MTPTPESQQAALLPCPFCKSESVHFVLERYESSFSGAINCRHCDARGASTECWVPTAAEAEAEASEKWNAVPRPPAPVEVRRECAEFTNEVFYLARAMYQQFCADHYATMDHEPEDWKYMSHLHRHPWLRKAKAISDRLAASTGKE